MLSITPEIQTFLAAMTPVGELKSSIPIGLLIHKLNWGVVYVISVMGNLVPVVLLLLFLKPFSVFLSKKFKICHYLFSWFFEKTKKRYNFAMEKYGSPALITFVAIPLPMTGGWTAAILAFLFDIPFRKAFPAIMLGIVIGGLLVLLATFVGISIEQYFDWKTLIGILLFSGFIYWIYKKYDKNRRNY